jgi:hypothetical protein
VSLAAHLSQAVTSEAPPRLSRLQARVLIVQEAVRLCYRAFPAAVRAIVLTGSLARDEATTTDEGCFRQVLGDAEFLVVFHDPDPLPTAAQAHTVRSAITAALLPLGVICRVSLTVVHQTYLRRLRPHIFAYELRSKGQVVAGDRDVLAGIPDFGASEIPPEDAWRLLCNRVIELFDGAAPGSATGEPPQPAAARYRTVKLYLDMATSYLVFIGAYEPSYRERSTRLRALVASRPHAAPEPFPLSAFTEAVDWCTRVKLQGPSTVSGDAASWHTLGDQALVHARRLWRWEVGQLTGRDPDASPRLLWQAMLRRQPVAARLRGWLYVLRQRGWQRSWRQWPRWLRLALRGSPRYLVYAAASELLFARDPAGGFAPSQVSLWADIRNVLPVVRDWPDPGGEETLRRLGADILANYHEFLENTRS